MEELSRLDGVSAVYPLLYGQITVPWEPDFADQWMEEFYDKWMMIPYEEDRSEYQQYPENFGSVILGISEEEFPYLQEVTDTTLDREAFLSGKSCVPLSKRGGAYDGKTGGKAGDLRRIRGQREYPHL